MADKHIVNAGLPSWEARPATSRADQRETAKRAATRLTEIQRRIQWLTENASAQDIASLLLKVVQFDEAFVDAPSHESSSSVATALVHPSGTVKNYQPSTNTWNDGESIANIVDALGLVYDQDETTICFPHNGHWVPLFARTVRTAQTCNDFDGTYPDSGDSPTVYPIKFVKVEFDEEAGQQTRTVTNLRAGSLPDAYVCNIAGDDTTESGDSSSSGGGDPAAYIAVDSLIEVYQVTDQWFTRVSDGSGGKAKAIEFAADVDFTTSTASFSATVTRYYDGTDPGTTVTIYNMEKCAEDGDYVFWGYECNEGMAILDEIEDKYRLWNFQCPTNLESSSSLGVSSST